MAYRFLNMLLAALLLLSGSPVAARSDSRSTVELKPEMCFAVGPAEVRPSGLGYRCTGTPRGYSDRWLWLRADRPSFERLPADWRLLIDQTRFSAMRLVIERNDGSFEERRVAPGEAGRYWAPGGLLAFDMDERRAPIARVHVGVHRLVDYGTMRKIRAVSGETFDRSRTLWVALVAGFSGIVIATLILTLFLYAGLRQGFLRQHALWSVAILAYGLCWSNLVFAAFPSLAGSWGVRLNLWTAGTSAMFATWFLAEFLESDVLPRAWKRMLIAVGFATLGGSVVASLDGVSMALARLGDRAANAAMALQTLTAICCLVIARRRGSRAALFYGFAWSPTLALFLVRGLRNFYLIPHRDWMDMAMYGAAAFQALLLSAAISDRFLALRRERDRAEAESAEFNRLANNDPLTGIENRRGLLARADAMLADPAAGGMGLLLFDLDFFKRINDRYGHDAGDRVLVDVARILSSRPGAARLGGEEFGMLLRCARDELFDVAEELRRAIADTQFRFGDDEVKITTSIGATWTDSAQTFHDLYRDADAALYRAKENGRNRIVFAPDRLGAGADPARDPRTVASVALQPAC